MKPAHVKNETSQVTYVGESNSTPSKVRLLSREGVKNDWRDEQTDGAADWSRTASWPCHDPIFITPSWSSAAPGLAGWLWDRDQTTGETNCCIAKVISNDILDRNVRFREDGTFWCKTFCRPLRNVMTWLEELVNHGLNGSGHACIQYLRAFFASGRLGRRPAGTLISGLGCFELLARSCGAELEDHQKCIPHVVACALKLVLRQPCRVSEQHQCLTKSC